MVTIEIVINSTPVHSTLFYILVVLHCLRGDAFGFCVCFFSVILQVWRAVCSRRYTWWSGGERGGEHVLSHNLLVDFDSVFTFFQNGRYFYLVYIVLIFVARWRHNICEIVAKNCKNDQNRRKSLCAPRRTDSQEISKKLPPWHFRARKVDAHFQYRTALRTLL